MNNYYVNHVNVNHNYLARASTDFPLDLTGELAAPAVQSWLEQAREVNLQTLDDTSFEHLTQASTGATTGDWLVML